MEHEGKEYSPFGEGWVRRDAGSEDDWEEVEQDDVPNEVIDHFGEVLPARYADIAEGIHPDGGQPFAEIRRVSEGESPFEE